MTQGTKGLERCAQLVNEALVSAAEAGATPKVLDHLLDTMRAIASERESASVGSDGDAGTGITPGRPGVS